MAEFFAPSVATTASDPGELTHGTVSVQLKVPFALEVQAANGVPSSVMVRELDPANPLSLTVKTVPGPPLFGLRTRLPGTTVKFAEALRVPSLPATTWPPAGIKG